ncbi:glycogen debranching N-terminal domain-containing protein, partial [Cellulomonas triticagri]
MELQPLLHDLLVAVHAPTQAWSGEDGQVALADGRGAQGVYHGDVRVLRGAHLTVDGAAPEAVASGADGPGRARAVLLARGVDGPGA